MPAHLSGPFLPAGPSAGASAPRPAAPVAGGAAAPANPALTRRAAAATLLTAAASALALALAAPPPASAGLLPGLGKPLGGGGGARAAPPSQSPDPATTPTARAYLEVGLCPGGFRPDRALGDPSALCDSPEPLGRIEIDLLGNLAPATVAQFTQLASAGDLDGTLFHRVFPGRYISAGRQGPRRMGGVAPSEALPANADLTTAAAFRARHLRPGTVSLAVAASDDEPFLRGRPGYRPAGFNITTGPGPVPSLDGGNVVFGRVVRGLDVVSAVAGMQALGPTPGPFNALATALGDERGAQARSRFGQPLRLVVIMRAGLVKQ